ncbi:MAG: ATP-binding protein [Eubacterium sp.]|nr:ATP-binding protein [Eubacterium sp.]MDE6155708.1 ATP-binding protein [Eubacterium sp.]MDE6767315.1 ATP-binding protein [Eubacterium sp.]
MSYSQEVYSRATEMLERRRERANLEAQERFDEISEKLPELDIIQRKLAQIGLNISKVFLYSADKQADIEQLMKESLDLQQEKKATLIKNGYGENALDVQFTCSACKDTGFIGSRRCKCHNELLKDIERSSLAKIAPIEDCTFETFDTRYYPEQVMENGISPRDKAEKIKKSCSKYAVNFGRSSKNIMFMGGTGLGKTHLSLAIANVVINKGYSVVYGTAQNILSDLQNENFGRDNNLRYYERAVLNCDLLILDDLGTEFKSSYTVACLYNIINSRLSAKLPTIISTNFTLDELEDKYDQRITSRITGEYSQLVLVGNDIRYIK